MEAVIKDGKIIVREQESEDERIRREIANFIRRAIDRGSITKELRERSGTWLAYLEKQKEQKEQKERSHFVMRVLSDGHMKKAIEIYSDECDCKVGDVVKAIIRKKD